EVRRAAFYESVRLVFDQHQYGCQQSGNLHRRRRDAEPRFSSRRPSAQSVSARSRMRAAAGAAIGLSLAATVSVLSLLQSRAQAGESILASTVEQPNVKSFAARGEIRELEPDGRTVLIRHGAISNYMEAMTMPFHVKDPTELSGLRVGDQIAFRL